MDGMRYLDASGGTVVVNIDHGVKEIGKAALAQMEQISFSHSSQFTNAAQEELGRRMEALSATGFISRRRNFQPMLLPFELIPPCNCYRCPFKKTYPECSVFCARELERVIEREGTENVAAFIGEPIVGSAAGATVPLPEYFPMIRDIYERNDIMFITDKMVCGTGRTGKPFAIEHWGVKPDFIAAGKGMASGYAPLPGLLVSEHIHRTINNGSGILGHAHTFMGNLHSCAVGVAVLQYLEEHDLINRCARMGDYLFSVLEPLWAHPLVGDKGLFAGIDFIQENVTHRPYLRKFQIAERVTDDAFQNSLISLPWVGRRSHRDG